jgi:hypothetical protein
MNMKAKLRRGSLAVVQEGELLLSLFVVRNVARIE